MTNGWIYNGIQFEEKDIDKNVGFVYLIECTENGRKYIGKKLFNFKKSKQVKKKTKRFLAPSDWADYYGSSDELLADVEKFGKDKFTRTILRLCRTKAECTYFETKYHFSLDVLLDKTYYNGWIIARVRRTHLGPLIKDFESNGNLS